MENNFKRDIRRGDIYYIEHASSYEGSEQHAGRPAIIVSNDKNNAASNTVEVVYLTTQNKNDLPTHVQIRSTARLSTALCEQITSVSVSRVGDYAGMATEEEMRRVDAALMISLGIKDAPEEMPEIKLPAAPGGVTMDTEKIETKAQLKVYKKLYEDLLLRVMKGDAGK